MFKYILMFALAFFSFETKAQEAVEEEETAQVAIPEEEAAEEIAVKEADLREARTEDFIENMEERVALWTPEDVDKYNEESLTFNIKDKKGNTPLYYALSHNPSLDVAKKIIEYGADVNEPAANGMLPINVATSKANELQLQILMMKTMGLDMGNPKIEDQLEKKVFHEMSRMVEMAAVLIDAGADVNKESVLGTPLMNASTNRWNIEIINLLLKYGADVNKTDKNGRTALFYAFSSGNDDIVSLLIQAGANTEITDKDGKTYLELERTEIK